MAKVNANLDAVRDPSANVIQLVGNVKENLEAQLRLLREFYDQRLLLITESFKRESERIDFLRGVDVDAVKTAQAAQEKRTELIAIQTVENADTLRISVGETAKTLATQLQVVTASLDTRLKIVEEKQYLLAGSSKGSREMYGWITGGIMFLIVAAKFIIDSLPK